MKGKIVTRQEVAEWHGVTIKTVENWEKAGCQVHEVGAPGVATLLNSLDVDEFLYQRRVAKNIVTRNGETYDKQEEEARLKHHQANNEALKEAEAVGRLLDSVVVVELCSALVSNSRSRLLVIPNAIKNTFPHIDQELIDSIENAIIEALNELGEDGIPDSLRRVMGQYSFDMDSTPETDD